MKNIRNRVLTALAVLGLIISVSLPVQAATNGAGNGMRIAPVRTDLTLQPGSAKTVSVYVRNVTSSAASYTVVLNDFVASDESGAPSLLLNGEQNDKHGLKKYMTTDVKTLTVAAGQQKEVKVTVTIPRGTPGGGYYGAVRFVPGTGSAEGSNVALSGSVGSLILVRVPGDVVEKMSLVSFDAREGKAPEDTPRTVFTSNKNVFATVRFRNEGNVQEQPFGKITLKKGTKIVAQYEVNDSTQPANVLPDSVRKFQVELKNLGSFGKYTLEGNFGYGSAGQLLTAKTTFYVVPMWAIVLGLIVVAFVLFLIFGLPRMVKNYNKRVLRKAGRR